MKTQIWKSNGRTDKRPNSLSNKSPFLLGISPPPPSAMATSEKLLTHLRRRRFREISSLSNSLSFAVPPPISHRSLINPNSHYQLHHHGLFKSRHNLYFPSNLISLAPFSFSHSRSFSSGDSDYVGTDVAVESAIESIPPVRFLVSLLDGYHDVTGWPWWVAFFICLMRKMHEREEEKWNCFSDLFAGKILERENALLLLVILLGCSGKVGKGKIRKSYLIFFFYR